MKKKRKKTVQNYIEYSVVFWFEKFVRFLPDFLLKLLSKLLGFLVFKVVRYRHNVVLKNLAVAFPEKSAEERKKIAHGCYTHFVLMILEFIKMQSWSPQQLLEAVEVENPAQIEKVVRNGKGTLLVSGHFGNWEIGIALLAKLFWNGGSVIQKRQRNRLVDKWSADRRRRWDLNIIYSRGAISSGLAALSQNQLLALLGDQDGGKKGVFVPFFGRMSSIPLGTGLLFLRSKANFVFACCVRIDKFRYKVIVEPIGHEGNFEVNAENIQEISAKYMALLERYVRQYPEQYLWFHKYWKTKYVPVPDAPAIS